MMTVLGTRISLLVAVAYPLLASPGAVSAQPFSPAFMIPPVSGGPETRVVLAGHGRTLLYGSAAEDEPGAVGVFDARTGAEQLVVESPQATIAIQDDFGSSVALTRRLLVVSAPRDGAVYVFDRRGGLLQTLAVPFPGGVAATGPYVFVNAAGSVRRFDARTGQHLGDLPGGVPAAAGSRVFVGQPGTGSVSGALLAFDAASGAPLWSASAPVSAPGDGFGSSVAADRDKVLVGSPGGNAAYLLRGRDGSARRALLDPDGTGNRFGHAVALGGGFLLVGAPEADSIETDSGKAHVFSRRGDFLQTLDPEPTTFCAAAGTAVALGRGWAAVGMRDCFGDARVFGYRR